MRACLTILILGVASIGCTGPSRVKPPHIDPESAAAEAISLYDTNGDGALDKAELAACGGIASKLGAYDSDQDGSVTKQEIGARIARRRTSRVGLTRLKCRVRLNGRPLPAANVTFEPETYLGNEIKTAYGTTTSSGSTAMAIPDEELPKQHRGLNGLHMGTYKVRITHPEIELPSKYNTETELGFETELGQALAEFNLEMKSPRRN